MSKRLWAVTGLVAVAVLGAGLATVGFGEASGHEAPPIGATAPTSPTSPASVESAGPEVARSSGAPSPAYPQNGSGKWTVAAGSTPVVGHGGSLLRFQVAVERDIGGLDVDRFAADVFATLSDERSWIGTGNVRFQRVGPGETPNFTLYLATPATRDVLCQSSYDRYTSCRRDNKVVLNVARWLTGVPNYGADLDVYRQYMVNHEVGHRVGNGHELCPGPGRPAPVMQQQTLGMHGCVANPWVMVDGKRYSGRSGQYDDHVPR